MQLKCSKNNLKWIVLFDLIIDPDLGIRLYLNKLFK